MTKEKIEGLNITNIEKEPNINNKDKKMQELNINSNVIENLKVNIEKLKKQKSYNLFVASSTLVLAIGGFVACFADSPIANTGYSLLTLGGISGLSYLNYINQHNQIESLEEEISLLKEIKSPETPTPTLKRVRKYQNKLFLNFHL